MARLPVLITRAEPGAAETAGHVRAGGYRPVTSSALELIARPEEPLDITGATGLIFTSANGVRFFAGRVKSSTLTAWCVGPATLAAAQAAGFTDAVSADGNAEDLAELLVRDANPADGRLVHVANKAAAGRMATTLRERGFEVAFAPVYETRPADSLTPEAVALVAGNETCALLIHSAKGAEAFAALAGGQSPAHMHMAAVSQAAAQPLEDRTFASVHIADRPNEAALMKALGSLAAAL